MHDRVSETPAAPGVHKLGINLLIQGTHPALAWLRAGLVQALHPSRSSSQAAHHRQHAAQRQQTPSLTHPSNPGQPKEELTHLPPQDWGCNCPFHPQGWGDPEAAAGTGGGVDDLQCHREEPDSPANSLKWFPMSKAW